jgi:hypothetical protein
MTEIAPDSVVAHPWGNGCYGFIITYQSTSFPPMGNYASGQAAIMAGEQRLKTYGADFTHPFAQPDQAVSSP